MNKFKKGKLLVSVISGLVILIRVNIQLHFRINCWLNINYLALLLSKIVEFNLKLPLSATVSKLGFYRLDTNFYYRDRL
jgi:hypothetical protein